MIKLILAVFSSIFILVSAALIYYWRDIQYDPSAMDLFSYFILLPLVLSFILLSPYLIYQAYQSYKKHKQQQALRLQQQATPQVVEQKQDVVAVKWLNLNLFSSFALSAFGEDDAIIDELKNFKSPELDHSLTNNYGLPVLSYRITALDEQLDADSTIEEGRTARIKALIQQQLEQQCEILYNIAEHLKQSAFFYDSEIAYQYRMHPAWIDANYQSDDPDHVEQQAQQVPRLNQLNIHLLLPYNLLLLWDEHSAQAMLQDFMQTLGVVSQQVNIQHHFIEQANAYSDWLALLDEISTQTEQVSVLINVDSEIDQDVLDEKMWQTDHYVAAEFASSWCIAAPDVKIQQAEAIKQLKIALNVQDLSACLSHGAPDSVDAIEQEQPFVLLLDEATEIKVIKQTNQTFAATLIESHHFLHSKPIFGDTQALAKIGGFMLGPHLSTQNTAMIYSTDQASTHAFFQANLESHSFKPVI